jgi:hypothetical protein
MHSKDNIEEKKELRSDLQEAQCGKLKADLEKPECQGLAVDTYYCGWCVSSSYEWGQHLERLNGPSTKKYT